MIFSLVRNSPVEGGSATAGFVGLMRAVHQIDGRKIVVDFGTVLWLVDIGSAIAVNVATLVGDVISWAAPYLPRP
ncbi:hypothetical protein [Nocardia miyunensis]|uniref:hypothetical protein n=1 Tax=Nocardia miyunensis TaxID=282684 RepID=UPI0012F4CE41|nr:hypothetical protein [Nocardia miyunensis]